MDRPPPRVLVVVADRHGATLQIAGAVYHGRWPAPARRYAARHAAVLTSLPVRLLGSGPLGAESPDEEPPGIAAVRLMPGAPTGALAR